MTDEREFLEAARIDSATLEVWIVQEWLIPRGSAGRRTYSDMDLARARLIADLKQNMGVNDEGLDVILHLIDQMHGLRRALAEALARLRERESAPGGGE